MDERQQERIERASKTYEQLAESCEIWIPEEGLLAGRRTRLERVDFAAFQKMDNMHFPLSDFYLRCGVPGIIAKARETMKKISDTSCLEGVVSAWTAFARYIERHAVLAEKCSEQAADRQEKQRYAQIAAICRRLTEGKPETFQEALQLFWFAYLFRSPFGAGCIGRLDQYLKPFYEADCRRGRWNRQEALQSVMDLYRRLNENRTGDTLRNLMLSGQDENGRDETCEVTYLLMEAYEKTPDAEPHLNVRIHPGTPERLKEACLRLLEHGGGQPTLYFDQWIMPAMEKAGIPHADACRYANDGCTETVIDGRGGICFWQFELVKTVELALFNGQENPFVTPVSMKKSSARAPEFTPKTGLRIGFRSGAPEELKTFADFKAAFYRQMEAQLDWYMEQIRQKMEEDLTVTVTSPFVAGTCEACLKTGKDPLRGGGFSVPNYQLLSGSVGTAADCLRAVELHVFEKKEVSLSELVQALSTDFAGREPLRQKLLHGPRYGNDDEKTDELAAELASFFIEKVNAFRGPQGRRLYPGLYNIDFKIAANLTGATPDGRRFRDAVAEHCSPTPGAARLGPTAVICSASRLPMREGFASSPLHLTLDKSGYQMGADRKQIIKTLMETAEEKGIPVLSLTMYDREELADARRHPEQHRDLIVRVWGFQARFVELDTDLQEHIMNRIC